MVPVRGIRRRGAANRRLRLRGVGGEGGAQAVLPLTHGFVPVGLPGRGVGGRHPLSGLPGQGREVGRQGAVLARVQLDQLADLLQLVHAALVDAHLALGCRRSDQVHRDGHRCRRHRDRGERQRATARAGPSRGRGLRLLRLARTHLLLAPKVTQVEAEHGSGKHPDHQHLQQEPDRDLATQHVVDQRDQVADQHRRGHEQRQVSQPAPHRRQPARGIGPLLASQQPGHEQEDRHRDHERRHRPAHRLHPPVHHPRRIGRVGEGMVDQVEQQAAQVPGRQVQRGEQQQVEERVAR